jgi:Ca2+-binding RTX toxin-like protein
MRARFWLLVVVPVALAALVGIASATTTVTISGPPGGRTIHLDGGTGDDTLAIEIIPGVSDPNQRFYEIHDPGGIPDPVPAGCFRFDADTIHCPVDGVTEFDIDMHSGDDRVVIGPNINLGMHIEGDAGNDNFAGGDGNDLLEGEEDRDVLDGGLGRDTRDGGLGHDRLLPSPGNDIQLGGSGNDFIAGGAGNDRQSGGPGADRIFGGSGRDSQNGGAGRDRCNGGPGNDSARRCEIGANY